MDYNFIEIMTSKSDGELYDYIENRTKYNPKAVVAAIQQLQGRGKIFTDSELAEISDDISKQEKISKKRIEESESGFFKWLEDLDFVNSIKQFDFAKWYKEKKFASRFKAFVSNRQNQHAFLISFLCVGVGTFCVLGMYPGDALHIENFSEFGCLLTLPVNVISSTYRFTENANDLLPVYIIQSLMLIPVFIVAKDLLFRRRNRIEFWKKYNT